MGGGRGGGNSICAPKIKSFRGTKYVCGKNASVYNQVYPVSPYICRR